MAHRQMVRNGDAWVGITDKPIDVLALKKFDPARYGSLSFANPLALDDPRNCQDPVTSVDPPSARSRSTEDGLAWDIYSQVGALVRSRDGANPLAYGGGHRGGWRGHRPAVKHVYGFGYSQTGGDLYDYINAIHPLDVARNGHPIYDGYIVAVAGGNFVGIVPINQCEPPPGVGDPRLQFSNVGVPIMHVMSQSDYLFGIDARRDDSDAPADRFRHYEMAGAAHATPDELNFSATSADIVKAGVAVPPMNCNEGPRSRFPSRIFFDAMLRNLDQWVRYGISAAARRSDRGGRQRGRARRVRQRRRRPALALPRRADEHVVRQLDRRLVLHHRRPRGALRRRAPADALHDARCLRPRRGQGHGQAGGRALHHRLRRPRPHPGGGAGRRPVSSGQRVSWKSSIALPEGSSSRI